MSRQWSEMRQPEPIVFDDGRVVRDGELDSDATMAMFFQKEHTQQMFVVPEASAMCSFCGWEGTLHPKRDTCPECGYFVTRG